MKQPELHYSSFIILPVSIKEILRSITNFRADKANVPSNNKGNAFFVPVIVLTLVKFILVFLSCRR